jgi:hypothetical protein
MPGTPGQARPQASLTLWFLDICLVGLHSSHKKKYVTYKGKGRPGSHARLGPGLPFAL